MKKVLIALDYDPTAQKVAEMGYAMAKANLSEVTLLHITADPVFYAYPEYSPIMGYNPYGEVGSFQDSNLEGLNKAAYSFLNKTRHHLGDENIKTMVVDGDIADTILETIKKGNFNIAVLGTHSGKWLEDILMGSVATKVLHHSQIPLYIIPTRKHK